MGILEPNPALPSNDNIVGLRVDNSGVSLGLLPHVPHLQHLVYV